MAKDQTRAKEVLAKHVFAPVTAVDDTVSGCVCGWRGPVCPERREAHDFWVTHLGMLPEPERQERGWAVMVTQRVNEHQDDM